MRKFDHDVIRAMTEAELELVLSWRNHPDIRRFMLTQTEIRYEDHKKWFKRASQTAGKHLLIFETNGQPTGFVQFTLEQPSNVCDWGFYLAPDAVKGVGSRLGQTALSYAFQSLHAHKVCGKALAYNEKSIRFHKRLGFVQEGELRDQHLIDNHYHNLLCFGLLRSEWSSGLQRVFS